MSEASDDAAADSYRCAWRGRTTVVTVRGEFVYEEILDRLGRPVGTRSVGLADLSPVADRTWHKDERRHKAAAACVGAAIAVGALGLGYLDVSVRTWLWFAVGVAVTFVGSVLYAFLDPYRVEYAWFHYRSGVTAFTFCRSGADAAKFDSFVARLEQRIRDAG